MGKRKPRSKKKKAAEKVPEGGEPFWKSRAVLGAIAFIAAVAFLLYARPTESGPSPEIRVAPTQLDYGVVSLAGGEVFRDFQVSNGGEGDLVIRGMDSSCGCTTATMIYRGDEGPRFGMAAHGTNPRGWSLTIPPGESATLRIYYDPRVHPELRGPVVRWITLFTNDPDQPEVEVYIRVDQVA
jgi:hypothetical protein